jgi:hypothetical protein
MDNRYVLVCDERGSIAWPSRKRTFTIGGFAAKESHRLQLIETWNEIKDTLCGNSVVELKWSHFFPGNHQKNNPSPLLSNNPTEWRTQALWALDRFFENTDVFPITVIVQKDKTASTLFDIKPSGKQVLSIFQLTGAIVGQFALYLQEHDGDYGEIWFDQLSSRKEEERLKAKFQKLFGNLSGVKPEFQPIIRRINPEIKFFDSKFEPLVQLADFISGVFWAASEGDQWFFGQMLEKYAPGRKRTYGILFLQA